jgi:hypothetical protein
MDSESLNEDWQGEANIVETQINAIEDVTPKPVFNRANLEKLMLGLLQPTLPAAFDMNVYCAPDAKATCGSVGCSLGHASFYVEPRQKMHKDYYETWMDYAKRVFNISEDESRPLWGWIFSYHWHDRDNTPEGAAARIAYVLKHGKAPDNWIEQRRGDAPLCYRA